MLLVYVHELEIVFTDAILLGALEYQVDDIRRVLSLDGQDIGGLSSAKNLGERAKIDAQSDVAVAAERREGLSLEHHGHEGDVGIVHGLEGNAGVIAVEVAVLDEATDGVDHLYELAFAMARTYWHIAILS
jgi:hypothetical protein